MGDEVLYAEPRAVGWLLNEYSAALQGKPAAGTSFYPEADDRALTVMRIAYSSVGRASLITSGVVPLLAKSLHHEMVGDPIATARLWTSAVQTIHLLATKTHHAVLQENYEITSGLLAIAAGRQPSTKNEYDEVPAAGVGQNVRHLAADAAVALGARWDVERQLWLGVLKSQSEDRCPLALLPTPLIRNIVKWVILQENIPTEKLKRIHNPWRSV